MSEPAIAKAALRREGRPEVGLEISVSVQDPDVIAEVQRRSEGAEREEYLRTALRIGVLALRQAGGTIDAQALHNEGSRLVELVESRLRAHAQALDDSLEKELRSYFDPATGQLQQRVKALVSEDGELARLLRQHVSGDASLMAQQMAKAVGENSALMRHLSPQQQDGLVLTISRVAEERLAQQSNKILAEFDLNKKESALSRLVGQIETNFDPDNEASALGVIKAALAKTQDQIRRDLSLDEGDKSALGRLQGVLKKQLAEVFDAQTKFQQELREALGVKMVQARTTEGGFSFEHACGLALNQRVRGLGDEFESVGELRGLQGRSTGDHVQRMGMESAVPGGVIVYECKRDKSYRVKVALDELAEARKNRGAEVGVFVMAAQTLRESDALRGEYPSALSRWGNDILVVWDDENPASDVNLDAAISLARALVVRASGNGGPELAADMDEMTSALVDLEKQIERFEKMGKNCDSIVKGAESIKEELLKIAKRIEIDCRRLNENVQALKEGT